MRFEALRRRVERNEALVEGRRVQTGGHVDALRAHWRDGLTPTRIVIAGLLGGFIVGRSQPTRALRTLGKLGGPQALRAISALSAVLTSVRAAFAAVTAKAAEAADGAGEEAATA
ncbi:MAG: hypothetical protein ACREO8_05360, partial [Luteimonas sp.]